MKLLAEGKFQKYTLYAIGEIFLVVVGILIALQINNWNEARKESALVVSYLEGIQEDLNKDIQLINEVLTEQSVSISLISSIDLVFTDAMVHAPDRYPELFNNVDKSRFTFLFYRGKSFRSINGNYNSLISDGKSGLIKNRDLFAKLQGIYNERHRRIDSVYDSLKERDTQINWTYAYQKRHWTYDDLEKAKDEKVFLDLANFAEMKFFYATDLVELKERIQEVIVLIENEVNLMSSSTT
ncbi:MAG: hypothetical protein KJO69_02940 [Gammaproteobacteria bacterium]|nr:hypothetical protein [Gammaproteobacteria bacterium]NNJ72964.1 hypothetical protein [Enterobacterales bacterium]